MSKLYRVRTPRVLNYPDSFSIKNENLLGSGGIVDLDDPFMAHLCAPQMNKLEPAPEGAVPSDLSMNRTYVSLRARWEVDNGVKPASAPPRTAKVEALVEDAKRDGTIGSIPKPDARPTRGPSPVTASKAS